MRRKRFASIPLLDFLCPRCAHPTLYATAKGHRRYKTTRHRVRDGIVYAVRCKRRGCGWASPVCPVCLFPNMVRNIEKAKEQEALERARQGRST